MVGKANGNKDVSNNIPVSNTSSSVGKLTESPQGGQSNHHHIDDNSREYIADRVTNPKSSTVENMSPQSPIRKPYRRENRNINISSVNQSDTRLDPNIEETLIAFVAAATRRRRAPIPNPLRARPMQHAFLRARINQAKATAQPNNNGIDGDNDFKNSASSHSAQANSAANIQATSRSPSSP